MDIRIVRHGQTEWKPPCSGGAKPENCSINLLEYKAGRFHALDIDLSQDEFGAKYGKK